MSLKRQIIKIDEEKCTGCGNCIPNCPEGALQIIDGKARLISDLFCDGLGACIGTCPEGAIITEIRDAEPYDEKKVMKNIVKAGTNTIIAHLTHLKNHNELSLFAEAMDYLKENKIKLPKAFSKNKKDDNQQCGCDENPKQNHTEGFLGGCPGARSIDFSKLPSKHEDKDSILNLNTNLQKSNLRNWPIQIFLAPLQAIYFNNADLLIAADCVNAAYPNLHQKYLKNRTLLIGCPKLDNGQQYIEKLAQIFQLNQIHSIHALIMEVPCCSGLIYIIKQALQLANKEQQIPFTYEVITIDGNIKS